jgi:hypothetical protein
MSGGAARSPVHVYVILHPEYKPERGSEARS